MDMPQEEQLKMLKVRIRNLERALAESEALSLEQIECTHRLENQLFEAQAQLEAQHKTIESCHIDHEQLRQRPTAEAYEVQAQHIEELQKLIWELERRPSLELYQILQQQLATGQTEIDMLKLELQRRIEPSRFYQLQHEFLSLKQYLNQLDSYATNLAEPDPELEVLRQRVIELEQQPQDLIQAESASQAENQRLQAEIGSLRQALEQAKAQQEQALAEQALQEQILQAQLNMAQVAQHQLQQELADRPTFEEVSALTTEIQRLQARLAELEAERERLVEAAAEHLTLAQFQEAQRRQDLIGSHQREVEHLRGELNSLQQQLIAAHAQEESLQEELSRRLQLRQQELEQQRSELVEAHRQEITDLQARILKLQQQLTEASSQRDQAEHELSQQAQRIRQVQAEVALRQEESNGLRVSIGQLQAQLEAFGAERSDLQARIQEQIQQSGHDQGLLAEQQQELMALRSEVQELGWQLAIASRRQEELTQELAQRPAAEELVQISSQWQESQRRQEVAEAHRLVSQRQVEKLQQRIVELESECVQAHAYAQTQEKEVAMLQERLALNDLVPLPTPIPPVPLSPRITHGLKERMSADALAARAFAQQAARSAQEPVLSPRRSGIPPLSLDLQDARPPLPSHRFKSISNHNNR